MSCPVLAEDDVPGQQSSPVGGDLAGMGRTRCADDGRHARARFCDSRPVPARVPTGSVCLPRVPRTVLLISERRSARNGPLAKDSRKIPF